MSIYLSVDGGGTKTAFLLVNEQGEKLASTVLGPANYIVNGLESVIDTLREGLEEVCKQAKIREQEISAGFVAIAGFKDIPSDIPLVTSAIESAFPNLRLFLGNDTENALVGSLLGESGIHIIAGTGSIGLGLDENNKYIRSGGWHHLFGGDEGSGYWIGCQLLQHFTKQADGREQRTYLYDYMMHTYKLECAQDVLTLVIEKWQGERHKIASLSLDVFKIAERGDTVALQIFRDAARELALLIKAIYQQGKFSSKVMVSYSGGVFKAWSYLKEALLNNLKDMDVEIVAPILEPLEGGIVLAMHQHQSEITSTIIHHLKQTKNHVEN